MKLRHIILKGDNKPYPRRSYNHQGAAQGTLKAEKLTQAARYKRNEACQDYRSGHYDRNLTTTSGDVTLYIPLF